MSDRRPTQFSRLATGDIRDLTVAADVPQSVRFTLNSLATAANPSNKHVIRGDFEVNHIVLTVVTALNASAKTINIGTDTSVSRFAAAAVSAGAANDRSIVTPASADVPAWVTTGGSAAAVTTVKAYITDVSGVTTGQAYVTFTYTQRS